MVKQKTIKKIWTLLLRHGLVCPRNEMKNCPECMNLYEKLKKTIN